MKGKEAKMLEVLTRLDVLAMAQKQGSAGNFEFDTLDNEHKSYYPHIHICI